MSDYGTTWQDIEPTPQLEKNPTRNALDRFTTDSNDTQENEYERDDYLLIRDDKVIAVSGNTDFNDGDHPIIGIKTDTVVQVVSNGDEIAYIAETICGECNEGLTHWCSAIKEDV